MKSPGAAGGLRRVYHRLPDLALIESQSQLLGRRHGAGRGPRRCAAHLGQQEGCDIKVRRRRRPHKGLSLAEFLEPCGLGPDLLHHKIRKTSSDVITTPISSGMPKSRFSPIAVPITSAISVA